MSVSTTPTIEEIRARADAATKGPWSVWDSCSWRRIGTTNPYQDGNVVCPINQRDGHPDLLAKREDLEFIAHSRADIDFLLAELKKRDDEAVRLKAENQYVCPHWSEPPQGTPIEILDKMGHALASLTSQDIDEKGKEVWRHFWQLDERLRVGQQPVALRIRAQDSERGLNGEVSKETS